ncbi:hydrolase 1, exosortase A system-associated [Janthinobacterium psychrotolerans]|uniref:Exosortase A system-associated hydrolase 1 n=1 Tax=Janthinobacterium psychrotolerans TaxID=1747903 RepID=A0A1A7BW30_9BURK|nr:hydrolase 1, exosortase A system-associated [Janthinobacterium psychrotolerans]OBV37781.1 exosortase A system-associated hydrolase 1 [Janthinobacterium psychrotolerans]
MHAELSPLTEVHQLALRFRCAGARLVGILTMPRAPGPRGVLIVTGGPQYRAGSHRQFVLLARFLAARGMAVMRFDYRGMGDSEGAPRDYRSVDADIGAALAQFFAAVPALREVVLWGLCDGATAAACHAPRDPRISGLILLNPWVRSPAVLARATLLHYYLPRLLQKNFWRKLAGGGVRIADSLAALRQVAADSQHAQEEPEAPAALLFQALRGFRGRVLLILSGDDLGAREWTTLMARDRAWRELGASRSWRHEEVAGASHTFSSAQARAQVERLCADWIAS